MNKLEYIPGDLVSVYVGVKKYIVEVIGTEDENEVLSYQIKFPNGEIQYADKDNIVPIPLTPEILEKNGWKKFKRPYSSDYCYRRKSYPTLNIRSEKEVYFHWGDHDKSIITIHQLQHILFVLVLITKWRCRYGQ
jgi:hypothetical protein